MTPVTTQIASETRLPLPSPRRVTPGERPRLTDREAAAPRESDDALKRSTGRLLERLARMQRAFWADGRNALLVVFQARDAGGKDGVIRKVIGAMDPMGVRVTGFSAPSDIERRHDFLWRVHAVVPPKGVVGVFNRSHYEDVLVARVRELVPRATWRGRFDHINAFEEMLADEGVTIVKFFLHVSREEQRRRLIARLEDPRKNWKFDAGDLGDRANWDAYTRAYRDAIGRCNSIRAPWYVIPADDKRVRDHLVARVLVQTLSRLRPSYPTSGADARKFLEQLR